LTSRGSEGGRAGVNCLWRWGCHVSKMMTQYGGEKERSGIRFLGRKEIEGILANTKVSEGLGIKESGGKGAAEVSPTPLPEKVWKTMQKKW